MFDFQIPYRFVVVEFVLAFIIFTPAYAKYGGGSGTAEDPHQISTAADLIALGEEPNDYDKHFILMADIDLDPNLRGRKVFDKAVIAPDTTTGPKFKFKGTAFSGVFDGNGHRIRGLTVISDDNYYVGLFGYIHGGDVRNMTLSGGHIRGLAYVGSVAGYNDGSITNCSSAGITENSECVGGLVGANSGSILNCEASGSVSGFWRVGGLVGYNEGIVSGSHSKCVVAGSGECTRQFLGGLVGANCGTITDCYSIGEFDLYFGENDMVGGVVGANGLLQSLAVAVRGYVYRSYCSGSVTGRDGIGGVVGVNQHGLISDCYFTGKVSGETNVGGLAGVNGYSNPILPAGEGVIEYSYSAGEVSGNEHTGGLVGTNTELQSELLGVVEHCYWDCETSSEPNMCGPEDRWMNASECDNSYGKTTAEMKQQSTFEDWDFMNVWDIGQNQTYPFLRTNSAGDVNKDGVVNFLDLCVLSEQWMEMR